MAVVEKQVMVGEEAGDKAMVQVPVGPDETIVVAEDKAMVLTERAQS